MTNKILVTGGAGFIGSHIAEESFAVRVIDDFSTANKYSIDFIEEQGIELVRGTITDYGSVCSVLEGVETVFHQAAIPSVPRSVEDPITTDKVNIGGTLTLLKACVDCGVKNVVSASSSSVYGDSETLPKVEEMPLSPKSPYAVSKAAGEHYMRVFSELYGLNTASLRYFNVFGERQNPDSEYSAVIPKFVKAALSGKPLKIFGDGSQTRDFTYVKDVVEANKLAAGKNGAFNIAGGSAITIKELAETIISLTESRSAIEYLPERSGDIKHSLAGITKAKEELSWVAKYSLEDGLKKYIDYFQNLL